MLRRVAVIVLAMLVVGGVAYGLFQFVRVALRPPVANCPANLGRPDAGALDYQPTPQVAQLIRRYEYAHWNEYGGEYLAHDALVEAMTGHLEEHRQAIAKIVGDPKRVRVIKVAHTQQQLTDVASHITKDKAYLDSQGVRLYSVASDGIYQQVRVGVTDTGPRTRALLRARYDTSLFCVVPLGPANGGAVIGPPRFDPAGVVTCNPGSRDPRDYFPQSVLSEPALSSEQLRADPAGAALIRFLDSTAGLSIYQDRTGSGADRTSGWKVIVRAPGHVLFGHGMARFDWTAVIEETGGAWKWGGSAGCGPVHPGVTGWRYSVPASDPTELRIQYGAGRCGAQHDQAIQQIYLNESADRVEVAVILSPLETGPGGCAGVGIQGQTSIHLAQPLGARPVYDAGPVPPQPAQRI